MDMYIISVEVVGYLSLWWWLNWIAVFVCNASDIGVKSLIFAIEASWTPFLLLHLNSLFVTKFLCTTGISGCYFILFFLTIVVDDGLHDKRDSHDQSDLSKETGACFFLSSFLLGLLLLALLLSLLLGRLFALLSLGSRRGICSCDLGRRLFFWHSFTERK